MNVTMLEPLDRSPSFSLVQNWLCDEAPNSPPRTIASLLAESDDACTRRIAAGALIETPPDLGHSVHALQSGAVEIMDTAGTQLMVVGEDSNQQSLIGSLDAWVGRAWTLTARALTDCRVVTVSDTAFRRLLQHHPVLCQAAGQAVTQLMRQVQLADLLRRMLGELPTGLLKLVADHAVWHQLNSGDLLIQQGQPVDSLYIVVSGRLQRLYRDAASARTIGGVTPGAPLAEVGTLGPGDAFGSLLDNAPYPTAVCAVRETTVIKLPPSLYAQLWQIYPRGVFPLMQQLSKQQRDILEAIRITPDERSVAPRTIAIIPASPHVDIQDFIHVLQASMRDYATVQTITRATVDGHFQQERVADIPPHHPMLPLLIDWLNAQEQVHNHVLYVGDASWSEWTQRCLSQADRVLIVTDMRDDPVWDDPMPTRLEQAVYDERERVKVGRGEEVTAAIELVLIHQPEVPQPQGTAAWLDARPVAGHYHVRWGNGQDFGTLARRLTGNAVGVVLSGGGAKGLVHLGLLRYLEEQGLPCDLVGGTSIGALIATPFALEWSYEKSMAFMSDFANPKSLFDYTLPLVSLFASDKVTEMLRTVFGERRIEDLWRPYFAISTDLTAAEMVVHDRGQLWRAVRASLSLPGIFAPLVAEGNNAEAGHLLVDGGIMNNFPVDVMRERMCNGQIIGLNIGTPTTHDAEEHAQPYDYDASISGWQILRSRLNPRAAAIQTPSLAGILMRTGMVNNTHLVQKTRQLCDILIEPDVSGYGLMQFASYAEIADVGYQAMHAEMVQSGIALA